MRVSQWDLEFSLGQECVPMFSKAVEFLYLLLSV